MSIANSLNDMITYLSEAYQALEYKQVILPENKNFKNLADTIAAITTGAQCYNSVEELEAEIDAANGTLAIVYSMNQNDEEGNPLPEVFYGLYQRINDKWEIAPSQLDAQKYHIVEGVGYGATGIINQGSFKESNCYSQTEVLDKINAWQAITKKTINASSLNNIAWAFQNVIFQEGNCFIPNIILPENPINMQGTFANIKISNVELIPIINTSLVQDMSYLFYQVSNIELINYLATTNFETRNARNMSYMFSGCQDAKLIEKLSEFWDGDTNGVDYMSHMFSGINNLSIVPYMNTRYVKDMSYMFAGTNSSQLITVPAYNTTRVNNMAGMFYNCCNLLYLPEFHVDNVSNIHNMFWMANNLKSIPNTWNFRRLTDASQGFMYCSNLPTVPILGNNIINANKMFYECSNLTTIANTGMTHTCDIEDMFYNCFNLINIGYLHNLGYNFYYNTLDESNIKIQTLNLSHAQNLTYNSVKNIANSVYNIQSLNKQGRIIINSAVNNLMTDADRLLFINKGWEYFVQ